MKSAASVYRPEIDGLRAVAVIPVMLFHYGVSGFGGGFIGVDIFYVISGFLIGGILWAEFTRTGTIRFGHFFMRRVRRLAPAYFLMAFTTLVLAYLLLLPFDFREFGQDLIAATTYLSNVHFFREAGYFDRASEQKLLLHTWSLAVEEQFYLFLPFFMLLLARARRYLPVVLALVCLASFAACLAMMELSPSAAFYLFPFRAWELMAGVLLAIVGYRAQLRWDVHPGLSWAGLALILGAVFLVRPGDHFPGLYALAPVVGAVLILMNIQQDNPVNGLLRTRPFLFFGAISYSLYLWHWPAITLAHYVLGKTLPFWLVGGLAVAVVAISWGSYRFVETPVRQGRIPRMTLLGGYAAASALCLGLGFVFYLSNGLPNRFGAEVRPHIAANSDFLQDFSRCHTPRDGAWAGIETCMLGPRRPPGVLIWGDSHGRAFMEGLARAATEADMPALLVWRGGCPPLLGIRKDESASSPLQDQACTQSNAAVLRALKASPSIDTVLLIGRWSYYADGQGVGVDAQNTIRLSPDASGAIKDGPQEAVFAQAWSYTIDQLDQVVPRIFVLRQMPEIFDYNAREAALDLAYGRLSAKAVAGELATTDRTALQIRNRTADAVLGRLARSGQITLIDMWDRMCSQDRCSAMPDGRSWYFDNNHITNTAALALRSAFAPVFEKARK